MNKNLSPNIFGLDLENIPSSFGKIDIEEAVYEFGQVMYKIGRFETDGKDTHKEYNKLLKRKKELTEIFDEFFNSNLKKLKV
jgi:hypothetical protein